MDKQHMSHFLHIDISCPDVVNLLFCEFFLVWNAHFYSVEKFIIQLTYEYNMLQ